MLKTCRSRRPWRISSRTNAIGRRDSAGCPAKPIRAPSRTSAAASESGVSLFAWLTIQTLGRLAGGMQASALETDAVIVSRLLRDEDRVMIGAGLDAPRAGALLAALTHAPELALCQSLGWIDVASLERPLP